MNKNDNKHILDKINAENGSRWLRWAIIAIIISAFFIGRATAATKAEINAYSDRVADYYEIPREILRAVIKVESDYVTNAVSSKNCYGLCQISENAYVDYKRMNPNTPYTNFSMVKFNYKANIAVGAYYLKRVCYRKKGNWKDALTAYFYGPYNTKITLVYYKRIMSKIES